MADTAWFEVHALFEVQNARPNVTPPEPFIGKRAVQESEVQSFHVYAGDDVRTRLFGIKSTITFTNGNLLHVQETYAELAQLVKLKVR